MNDKQLIILGSSARAAAQSACRAGYSVYWIDQFGDTDLRAIGQGRVIPEGGYPELLSELLRVAPAAPFLYTGALENYPETLGELQRARRLLGNNSAVCVSLQQHQSVADLFAAHGLPVPAVSGKPAAGRWLQKPVRGAGGAGIQLHDGRTPVGEVYLQQYIDGESRSAVFIGDGRHCQLLGVSRQLVGLPELHAQRYSYCGSVGPLTISARERANWSNLAELLVSEFALTGLFGIDAIVTGETVYPVEINPRYTASVEIYEKAWAITTIDLHCQASLNQVFTMPQGRATGVVAKGYLFAPHDLLFPDPTQMRRDLQLDTTTELADIPPTGQRISGGHPIMSLLLSHTDIDQAHNDLLQLATTIYDYCESGQ
ncbi:MAG: ATP-grasp domain-containing protein [Gammaproteobacteria bacterium]